MTYCHSCDKDYSRKYIRKHYSSEKHLKKTFEIKHIERHKKILVKDIVSVFSDLFKKHKRKFNYFFTICKFNNRKYDGIPKRALLKYYDKDAMVNVEFNLYSNIEDLTFKYYLTLSKPMLENLLIKHFDKYPEKLRVLDDTKAPYCRMLKLKHRLYDFQLYDLW